jgi:hypothetical protein
MSVPYMRSIIIKRGFKETVINDKKTIHNIVVKPSYTDVPFTYHPADKEEKSLTSELVKLEAPERKRTERKRTITDPEDMGLPAFMYGLNNYLIMYNDTQYIIFNDESFPYLFKDDIYYFTNVHDNGNYRTKVTITPPVNTIFKSMNGTSNYVASNSSYPYKPSIQSIYITQELNNNGKSRDNIIPGVKIDIPKVKIDIVVFTVIDIHAAFKWFKDSRKLIEIYDLNDTIKFPATILGLQKPNDTTLNIILYNSTHILNFDKTNLYAFKFPADISNILIYPEEVIQRNGKPPRSTTDVMAEWKNFIDSTAVSQEWTDNDEKESLVGRSLRKGGSRSRGSRSRGSRSRGSRMRHTQKRFHRK